MQGICPYWYSKIG